MSIEDKFDEVQQLIIIGKEKGYLLYDEVNDLLRADITSSDELDDLFSTFGSAGIEVVDSDQKFREEKPDGDDVELDLTPGTLDKTNDPVRMYLREMGSVELLSREGEIAIAKRIEEGLNQVHSSLASFPWSIHLLVEDYGMIHMHPTRLDADRFWVEGPPAYGAAVGTDLHIGRTGYGRLKGML